MNTIMNEDGEVFVTSRRSTPSIVDVVSETGRVFAELPDLIQEAAVSTEFCSPNLSIKRAQSLRIIEPYSMTQPIFYITSRTDSGIELPDLDVKDEKIISKYGADLTANFADIRAHGAKAFFQKENLSDQSVHSVCTCATGYIWISVRIIAEPTAVGEPTDVEVQIGTYALKARTITTMEIPFQYKHVGVGNPLDGQLALICSTVLGRYLQHRIQGQQYEQAAESAISQAKKEIPPLNFIAIKNFDNLDTLLGRVCANAPLPPTSDVSLISRSMITRRWQVWRERSVLRKRYFLPRRIIYCFSRSRHDAIDLLSGCYKALASKK